MAGANTEGKGKVGDGRGGGGESCVSNDSIEGGGAPQGR